jgi:hypothetical protein
MPEVMKDVLQSSAWIVAAVGGVIAAFMAVIQFREARLWRKTELAKKMLDDLFDNPSVTAAMVLVDWSNREFEVSPGERDRITREELLTALRTDDLHFTPKEVYIRDCFDALLDVFQSLEHYINRKLITYEDVKYPLEYVIEELSGCNKQLGIRPRISKYITDYNFVYAATFINRYDFWSLKQDRSRQPCIAEQQMVP